MDEEFHIFKESDVPGNARQNKTWPLRRTIMQGSLIQSQSSESVPIKPKSYVIPTNTWIQVFLYGNDLKLIVWPNFLDQLY